MLTSLFILGVLLTCPLVIAWILHHKLTLVKLYLLPGSRSEQFVWRYANGLTLGTIEGYTDPVAARYSSQILGRVYGHYFRLSNSGQRMCILMDRRQFNFLQQDAVRELEEKARVVV